MTSTPPRSAFTGTWSGQRQGAGGRYIYSKQELDTELDRRIRHQETRNKAVGPTHNAGSYKLRRMKEIVNLDGAWECAYCLRSLTLAPAQPSATIDHVMPKALGGAGKAITNMVLACTDCNFKKDAALPIGRWLPRRGLHRLVPSGQSRWREVVALEWSKVA